MYNHIKRRELKEGDLVYDPFWKTPVQVVQVAEGNVFLFRVIGHDLKKVKPRVTFSHTGDTSRFRLLDLKVPKPKEKYWYGTLETDIDTKRIIIKEKLGLFTIMVENAEKQYTAFPGLTIDVATEQIDYFIDDLGYDVFMDTEIIDILWEE